MMTSITSFISPFHATLCGTTLAVALASGSTFAIGTHDGAHGQDLELGTPGEASQATRTIEITTHDNYFDSEEVRVEEGETIRFVVKNDGQLMHEFNIGTSEMHAQHQQEMLIMLEHGMITATTINTEKMKMDHGDRRSIAHDDPNSVLMEPGTVSELIWNFSKSMDLEFACNIPGHYDAGMMGAFIFKGKTDLLAELD